MVYQLVNIFKIFKNAVELDFREEADVTVRRSKLCLKMCLSGHVITT